MNAPPSIFDPPNPNAVLSDLLSANFSLTAAAEHHNTDLASLCSFLLRPDIQARLAEVQGAIALTIRMAAGLQITSVLDSLRASMDAHAQTATSPLIPDTLEGLALREAANTNVRRAAALILRYSTFRPLPVNAPARSFPAPHNPAPEPARAQAIAPQPALSAPAPTQTSDQSPNRADAPWPPTSTRHSEALGHAPQTAISTAAAPAKPAPTLPTETHDSESHAAVVSNLAFSHTRQPADRPTSRFRPERESPRLYTTPSRLITAAHVTATATPTIPSQARTESRSLARPPAPP